MAKIYPGTKENLQLLAQHLRAGELVAVPSETVYGLAADALSASACRKIFRAKGRPANDPLIVHVRSIGEAGSIAELNDAARRLMRKFWPGPLTVVLPKKAVVPAVVTSGQPSVAVRMPAHPLFLQLLAEAGIPLAAPSANPFGYVSPTTAQHVQDGLGRRIKHILDGGPCAVGVESTIVDLRDPARPRLLRPGQITHAQLERALGVKVGRGLAPRGTVATSGRGPTKRAPAGMIAPGLLLRHYSPHTPVIMARKLSLRLALAGDPREAWVFLRRPAGAKDAVNIFGLAENSRSGSLQGFRAEGGARPPGALDRHLRAGPNSDSASAPRRSRSTLASAAHNLFALLRQLDAQGWKIIHVESAPAGGLGDAINDRLSRAAAKSRTNTPQDGRPE